MGKLKQNCWIVCEDGLIGTENQCLGIAESMGFDTKIMRINLKQPWRSLTPYIGFENKNIFGVELSPPWPDLLITGGRKAVAASRFIKKASGGRTFSVHLLDPKISPDSFDLVIVPAHDDLRGNNVIVTVAAPNRIKPDKLNVPAQSFSELTRLSSPRTAVLIGGNSKTHILPPAVMGDIVDRISELPGSLMITDSRRTPAESKLVLREMLKNRKDCFIWDGKGENPYFAMLSLADFIVVTNDSASMISEACTTGKPVYMIQIEKRADKKAVRIDKLLTKLQDLKVLRIFDGTLEQWSYEPLDDAAYIANKIRKRMKVK